MEESSPGGEWMWGASRRVLSIMMPDLGGEGQGVLLLVLLLLLMMMMGEAGVLWRLERVNLEPMSRASVLLPFSLR